MQPRIPFTTSRHCYLPIFFIACFFYKSKITIERLEHIPKAIDRRYSFDHFAKYKKNELR